MLYEIHGAWSFLAWEVLKKTKQAHVRVYSSSRRPFYKTNTQSVFVGSLSSAKSAISTNQQQFMLLIAAFLFSSSRQKRSDKAPPQSRARSRFPSCYRTIGCASRTLPRSLTVGTLCFIWNLHLGEFSNTNSFRILVSSSEFIFLSASGNSVCVPVRACVPVRPRVSPSLCVRDQTLICFCWALFPWWPCVEQIRWFCSRDCIAALSWLNERRL